MYQALYRKWRPKTFGEVVGQEHITATLKNEIRQGRPAHAYLLMGSRGTGKTTCARLIAKAVNCLSPVEGDPCGECEVCKGVESGSMVDVVEIDAASNNGVDSIRDLREEANFLPTVTKYRVYTIDECHMLSVGAVNALLKVLEEPPEHVIFILATTEVQKVPATIQSRCQRFDFKRIPTNLIAARLSHIAKEEAIPLEEEAAALIARLSDGGMRDALSLLDLCRAQEGAITPQAVSRAAGLLGQDHLFQMAEAIAAVELSDLLDQIARVGGQSVEYDRLCSQLVIHFRNLLMMLSSKQPEELVVCLPETLEQYRTQAKKFTPGRLIYAIRVLQEAQNAMTRTTSRRAELEMAAIRLCGPRLDQSPEALLDRIEKLEAKLNTALAVFSSDTTSTAGATSAAAPFSSVNPSAAGATSAAVPDVTTQAAGAAPVAATSAPRAKRAEPPPETAAPPPPAPSAPPKASRPPVGLEQEAVPFARWDEVLERLGKKNPAAKGALVDTTAYLAGGRVLIASDNPVFRALLRENQLTRESLKQAILEVTGTRYGIGPYTGPLPTAAAEKKANPVDDILQKAREAGVPVNIE